MCREDCLGQPPTATSASPNMVVLDNSCGVSVSVFQTEGWSVLLGEVGGCWVAFSTRDCREV